MADLKFSANGHPVCILHVDDDPSLIELFREILAGMGNFEIDCALCVDEALEKLKLAIMMLLFLIMRCL